MDNKTLILTLLVLGVILLIVYYVRKNFKFPKVGMFTLITGGIKSGKSTFAVALAIKTYKKVHRRYLIRKYILKMLRREPDEEPLIYSNIPLNMPYVQITNDLLLRKVRPRFGSVIFIDEASLVADSQLIQDKDINERLMVFVKLIGHELHALGGLIVNTQSTSDLHYSMRRCCDKRFYVDHTFKYLPFFLVQTIREERYSEDGSIVNAYNEDMEESLKKVLVRKKTWKMFDKCAFSIFTDNKPVLDKEIITDDLKVNTLTSFRDFKTLKQEDIKR